MSLLAKLDACESFEKEPHRADSVQELGAVLKLAAHNDAYRAFCFDVAGGADADCYDNAEVIFGNLRLAARDPTYHGNASLEQVLNYHKRCVPWSLVDDFVSERFPLFAESLENVLALRIRLSDILPIRTPAMTFDNMTSVNQGSRLRQEPTLQGIAIARRNCSGTCAGARPGASSWSGSIRSNSLPIRCCGRPRCRLSWSSGRRALRWRCRRR